MKKYLKNIMPEYLLTGIASPWFIWIVASWIDVIQHNTTDEIYQWWNFFVLMF